MCTVRKLAWQWTVEQWMIAWKSIIEVNVRMNSVPELGSGTRVTRLEFHWDWNFWNWNFYGEILKCSFLQRLSFPKVPEIGTTANFFIYLIPTIFSQKLCHLSHEKFIVILHHTVPHTVPHTIGCKYNRSPSENFFCILFLGLLNMKLVVYLNF